MGLLRGVAGEPAARGEHVGKGFSASSFHDAVRSSRTHQALIFLSFQVSPPPPPSCLSHSQRTLLFLQTTIRPLGAPFHIHVRPPDFGTWECCLSLSSPARLGCCCFASPFLSSIAIANLRDRVLGLLLPSFGSLHSQGPSLVWGGGPTAQWAVQASHVSSYSLGCVSQLSATTLPSLCPLAQSEPPTSV